MSKRDLVADVLDSAGATDALLGWQQRVRSPWLPVLTYHRVAELRPDDPFDASVNDATPDELDQQLAFISRNFDPIGLPDLIRYLAGDPLPRRPVLVTFDDGYRDNVDVALPILQRHGIPAVFFIATAYTTARRLFWWDRIRYTIVRSPRSRITLTYPAPLRLDVTTPAARDRAAARLVRLVKRRFGLDLDRFLRELAVAAGIRWDATVERPLADALLMTWDDIRELRAAGMSIGSHTRTHRVLQMIRGDELRDELLGSRMDLERELGEPIRALSYPVGGTIADRAEIRRAVAAAGFAVGFTNNTGPQRVTSALDRYGVHRMSLDVHTPPALFKARLAMPRMFG